MVHAQRLIQMGLHPSEILIGYEKAANKVYAELENQTCYTLKDMHDYDEVLMCMRAAVASKQYGLEDLLGGLITKACLYSLPKGARKLNVDNIRVQKILGEVSKTPRSSTAWSASGSQRQASIELPRPRSLSSTQTSRCSKERPKEPSF